MKNKFTHPGKKESKSENGLNQLELSKGQCNSFLCSLKNGNCTVNMLVGT